MERIKEAIEILEERVGHLSGTVQFVDDSDIEKCCLVEIDALLIAIETLQALDDGRMIELPCKVGDTVWITDCLSKKPHETKVTELMYFSKRGVRPWIVTVEYALKRYDNLDFGKTVFLTKEQAEAAKEVKNDA